MLRKCLVLSFGFIVNCASWASAQDPDVGGSVTSVRHGRAMALSDHNDAIFRTIGTARQACLSIENRKKAIAFTRKYPEHLSSAAVMCIAALTHQDMDLIAEGKNSLDVLRSAQTRFANENGVPEAFANTFTQMMGRMPLLDALGEIFVSMSAGLSLESFCRTGGEKELKSLIRVMGYIGPDPCDMEARQYFLEQVAQSSRDRDTAVREVADVLLKENVPEDMINTVPFPLKLRAISLRETQIDLADLFDRLRGMDQDEALALMSLYKHREDLRPHMWDLQKILSASYLEFLIKQRYAASRSLTGPILLACGEIEEETMCYVDALQDDALSEAKLQEIVSVRSSNLLYALLPYVDAS